MEPMKLPEWKKRANDMLDRFRVTHSRDDAVKADTFDRLLFDDMRDSARPLRRSLEDLDGTVDHPDDLLRDVLLSLWQDEPQLRPMRELSDEHKLHRVVLDDLLDSPEFDDLRRFTRHDKYTATLAACDLADDVAEIVKRHQDAVKEAAERAQEARKAADDLAKQVAAAGDEPDEQLIEQVQATADQAAAAERALEQALTDAKEQSSGDAAKSLESAREERVEENAMMKAWGVDPGELKNMDFATRAELASRISGSRLSEFYSLLGRMRLMAASSRAHKVIPGRDDVVDVENSNDLSRVLLTQVAFAQAHPALMLDFQRKFAEGELLSRKYEGFEEVGNGPIAVCVDTSSSMNAGRPTREVWAKAAALALLDEAQRLRRTYVGINYASAHQQREFSATGGQYDLNELLDWIEVFFRGSTNFDKPLTMAMDAIARDARLERADIVFITDGECRVSDAVLQRIERMRTENGMRVWGLAVGGGLASLSKWCDSVQHVERLDDTHQLEPLFQNLT